MIFLLVHEMADDGLPVAVACRVLHVSRSWYYEWRDRPPNPHEVADEALNRRTIREVWSCSRETYGVRRVRAELGLGLGVAISHKKTHRLMRSAGIAGIHRCEFRRHKPDRMRRQFVADRPDKLWVTDITQHHASGGWVYCAVVLDVFSRKVVNWSITDHIRAELEAAVSDMARPGGTSPVGPWCIATGARNTSRGSSATACEKRVRSGRWAPWPAPSTTPWWSPSPAPCRSSSSTARPGPAGPELTQAVFEWIEAFYNPVRRHSALGNLSPAEYETLPQQVRHDPNTNLSGRREHVRSGATDSPPMENQDQRAPTTTGHTQPQAAKHPPPNSTPASPTSTPHTLRR
ncbi:Integrase catalytic region [Segniliparus rotundus DSM 44985]|uniref:Integrase catalytic region n=1 Tax=Segniliparus rotundus (strain ATCC BAA-972 / CDC 1076 / CIP 108378 / DSM 44985 / JCM 13578) TaxID=640132 RepID=D6Z9D0_SEGRD|nr:Integrase catalytic region [Segniliparus rotundus DSM 44985]